MILKSKKKKKLVYPMPTFNFCINGHKVFKIKGVIKCPSCDVLLI